MSMSVRDLEPIEVRYLNRELLAERVVALQKQRADLEDEIKVLREALAEQVGR